MTLAKLNDAAYRAIVTNAIEALQKLLSVTDNTISDENEAGDCSVAIDRDTGVVTITPNDE